MENFIDDRTRTVEDSNTKQNPPLGFQIKTELSTIFGAIIQIWNFLCFFHEILCSGRRTISLAELTIELTEAVPNILYEAHMSMLRILLHMLMTLKCKSNKGIENSACLVAINGDLAILNELTWPELAWRYGFVFHLVHPSFEGENLDSSQVHDIARYVHGDGGSACGALTGLVGLEVDTQLFAAATNAIYGHLDHKDLIFINDTYSNSESGLVPPTILTNDGIPDWVRELEPVKHLKTNVGSKIRACIRKSIDKCPEEWAKEILERSISKEVYKGNASGPTKNAAMGVVARYHAGLKNVALRQRTGKSVSISTTVMRNCRILLRQVVSEFCKLQGKQNIRSRHILTRPLGVRTTDLRLDFRTIDMRLGAGTYCGSFQAFKEDVNELLNIMSPASSELVNNFEQEYKKEVLALYKKLLKYSELESLDPESRKDVERLTATTNEIPEVFWDGILCQVCGVDKDDHKLLLCDNCNEGYHIYCLCPPLSKVPPAGKKWYCPRHDASPVTCDASTCQERKESTGNVVTDHLAAMLQERDYWELNASERVGWLKFFEDMMMYMKNVQDYAKHKTSTSIGNKFLGVDSASRLYWKLDAGSNHCIVVGEKSTPHPILSQHSGSIPVEQPNSSVADGTQDVSPPKYEDIFCGSTSDYSSWICYQSEQEITRIMDFVKGDKLMERKLNDSVWKHPGVQQDVPDNLYGQNRKGLQSSSLKSPYPLTKATEHLQASYSPLAELSERNLHKGKTIATDNIFRCDCLELILPGRTLHCKDCHGTCATVKELRSHGDGICNLPPMMPFKGEEMCSSLNGEGTSSAAVNEFEKGTQRIGTCEDMEIDNTTMSSQKVDVELDTVGKFFEIPVLSKQPLKNEKSLDVLKHLKLSLLDMEAAVPEHAVKSSRACISKKQAWRKFVKSANTIYKMVQATLVFEDMIKPEFLGKSWQNWSSVSAAAKISTLAALSLRIYALDAAIGNSYSLEKPNLYPNATQGEAQRGQI